MDRIEKKSIVVRFAGDSGDGIQAIGKQMAATAIRQGNYIYTLSDYPGDIRSPAGTVRGISSFQLCCASEKVFTAGESLDALVAFNPAALKHALATLKAGGIILTDANKFTELDLKKAGYEENPLLQAELNNYRLVSIPITELTQISVAPYNLLRAQAFKCKNMFVLGIIYYVYGYSTEHTLAWIQDKFKDPNLIAANQAACIAGYEYASKNALLSELFVINSKQKNAAEKMRYITGNQAIVFGCLAVAAMAPKGLFMAGYPITPASEILQELTKYPDLNVVTLQAEDEIAAISAVLGAAFGGAIAITCTSGPGLDLKQEAIGLAVMVELPIVIVDVQRAGPSTGMSTKSEQTDLLAAMYGRHGEAPVVVLAPNSPGDCFWTMLEAVQIAVKYMTPVMVLSEATLANVAESWQIPSLANIPKLAVNYANDPQKFNLYARDPQTLARGWVIPGTVGLTHRIGGLEKKNIIGDPSEDADNHDQMVRLRASKIAKIAQDFTATTIDGDVTAELLVISWGATFGTIKSTINLLQAEGYKIAHIHLRYLNPLPNDLDLLIKQFTQVVAIETNLGQLTQILRAKYLVDIKLISRVSGRQFITSELKLRLKEFL